MHATLHVDSATAWPPLPLDEWRETYATLHLWMQMVGKTRLALAPMQNHWWQVAFYVTSRGLSTSPMPYGSRTFEIDFDFVDHLLVVRTSDGGIRTLALEPRPVAEFYRAYRELLRALDFEIRINPMPAEIADPVRFTEDRVHASYDGEAARRCWQILVQADRVLKQFRGRFLGKCSPVHFWWGSFDLACTRFSGRPQDEDVHATTKREAIAGAVLIGVLEGETARGIARRSRAQPGCRDHPRARDGSAAGIPSCPRRRS